MSSYFPLLPNIVDQHLAEDIFSSTDFVNYPSNHRKSSLKNSGNHSVFLATYKHGNNQWELISVDECQRGGFCRLSRNSMKVSNCEMIVSVASPDNDFKKQCRYLPKPSSLRIDSSPIAERASLNFHFKHCSSSYQGEYPFQMSCAARGSLWSFDVLKEIESDVCESFLILMNVNRDAQASSKVILEFYNPNHKEEKFYYPAKQNSFTVINLREISRLRSKGNPSSVFFFQCRSSLFIPMVLNVNTKTFQLALEHTHPPAELFWGNEKMEVVNSIKKRWLS